jgi:hypothetical protein
MSNYPTIQRISTQLMEAEARRLNKMISDINKENKHLRGTQIDGFTYNGDYFQPKQESLMLGAVYDPKTPLHHGLYSRMDAYLKDRKQVTADMIQIDQVMYLLLKGLTTDQERRDALPECVVACVKDFERLQRTRDEAYTLANSPLHRSQYERILPKMELYSMTRLLY